jgi:hypothetical protein
MQLLQRRKLAVFHDDDKDLAGIFMETSINPDFIPTDETTSHSTKLSAEELLAGHPKDDSQVAGYAALRKNSLLTYLS